MARIKYARNGKRDLHGLEEEYEHALDRLDDERWKHPANRENIKEYLKACKHGRAKSAGKHKKVKKSTLYRVLGILRLLSEQWLAKEFSEATNEDWQRLYERMEDDEIKNHHGEAYKPNSKAKNYKTIRKFLKWRGEEAYCEEWVTTEEAPTKDALSRAEVERMIEATPTLRVRTLLMLLFDGGFRIEELANLRWVDVQRPPERECYRAHIRKETSKTQRERWVSLWLATDFITSYRNSEKQRLGNAFDPNGYLFTTSYNKLYITVRRIGEKVLGRKISPHTMRHSSASYYANIIKTYQQFCSRYGWRLNSGVAQRYYHEKDDQEVASQAKDHEIARFKQAFEQLQLENRQLRRSIEQQAEKFGTAAEIISRLQQKVERLAQDEAAQE
jgi:integrase